jgi:flagellar hook-basal body complex protein FliE
MNDTISMVRTHKNHMGPLNSLGPQGSLGLQGSPYAGSGNNIIALEKKIGAEGITQAGTFQHAMLQALDRVSGAHHRASSLAQEAVVNPDVVDAHDITIAQAQANMSLGITRNILSRLVQGWRDLINTR